MDYPIRIPTLIKKEQLCNSLVPPTLRLRVFHFSRENIAKLKAKANSEIGTNGVSSLQALLAHLWRSAARNQSRHPDERVNFTLPIDVRSRLQPPLPLEYFGNAGQLGTVTIKKRELLEQGLGHVAWQIKKMIAMHTEEKIRNYLESWKRKPHLGGDTLSSSLVMGSSPRFDVYGNDFGWGKPIAVRSGPASMRDGRMTVFTGFEEGSVDIEACLSPETLAAMGNDAEFMDAVTASSFIS